MPNISQIHVRFVRAGKSSELRLTLKGCKSLQCRYNMTPSNEDVSSQIATLLSGGCLKELKDARDGTRWPLVLPSTLNYSMICDLTFYDLMILGDS